MTEPTALFRERPGGPIRSVELSAEEMAVLQELRINGGYEFEPGWVSTDLDGAYNEHLPDTISTRGQFDRILSQLAEKDLYRPTEEEDYGEVRPNPF